MAQQFDIAKSSNGTLGLITSKEMIEHEYSEGNKVMVWSGVIIQDNTFISKQNHQEIKAKAGGLWTSSKPVVVGHAEPSEIAKLA